MKRFHLCISGLIAMLAAGVTQHYMTNPPSTLLLFASLGGFVCLVVGAAQPSTTPPPGIKDYEQRERMEQDEIEKSRSEGNY